MYGSIKKNSTLITLTTRTPRPHFYLPKSLSLSLSFSKKPREIMANRNHKTFVCIHRSPFFCHLPLPLSCETKFPHLRPTRKYASFFFVPFSPWGGYYENKVVPSLFQPYTRKKTLTLKGFPSNTSYMCIFLLKK